MGGVVALQGFFQEIVTLFRAVAVEGFRFGHIVHCGVKGVDHRRSQGTGYVADAQTDDLFVRIGGGVFIDLVGNGGKQIAVCYLQKMTVDLHVV